MLDSPAEDPVTSPTPMEEFGEKLGDLAPKVVEPEQPK